MSTITKPQASMPWDSPNSAMECSNQCFGKMRRPMTNVMKTLQSGHPDYQPRYFGDLRARDIAYHQGTVWPWLIGPFVDAWRRVYPNRNEELRSISVGLGQHLATACIGNISEIFDAEPPYTPRGCCAQAWSVAEVLRLLTVTGAILREQKAA